MSPPAETDDSGGRGRSPTPCLSLVSGLTLFSITYKNQRFLYRSRVQNDLYCLLSLYDKKTGQFIMHLLQSLIDQFHFSHLNDLREQAHTYLLRGQCTAAITVCDAALSMLDEQDADRAHFFVCLGRAHYRLGDFDRAVTDFDHALMIDHHLAEAYANRGLAHHSLGHAADALCDLNVAAYLNPSFQPARVAIIDG